MSNRKDAEAQGATPNHGLTPQGRQVFLLLRGWVQLIKLIR